jgi:hypothetical protein
MCKNLYCKKHKFCHPTQLHQVTTVIPQPPVNPPYTCDGLKCPQSPVQPQPPVFNYCEQEAVEAQEAEGQQEVEAEGQQEAVEAQEVEGQAFYFL